MRNITEKCKQAFVALLIALMLGAAVLPAAPVFAQSAQDLQSQIAALLAQIAALQGGTVTQTTVTGVPSTFRFNRDLKLGASNLDVFYLQKVLNTDTATRVNVAGAVGGSGNETHYFGSLSHSAVIRFQNKYASEVLTPAGLSSGTGYVGVFTRTKLNAMIAGTIVPPPPPPPVGSSLNVSANQLTTTLLPPGALRVPLLRFTLSASGSSAITVTSMTAQLNGIVQTGAFDGLVLLDGNGNQIGQLHIVGSSRQVVFTDPITVHPGAPQTITIGANMVANLTAYQSQTAQLSLTDIRSNAQQTVAALPIIGPSVQVIATFQIGTATVSVGSTGTISSTRDIGTQSYNFSSIRVSAGSQEDILLRSIRFTQNGSAGSSDVAHVSSIVDGTAYPASVSGRVYTSVFGNGIRIPKGTTKEIMLRADVVSGAGRTILFDIESSSDIVLTGETFTFGIAPVPVSTSAASTATAEFTTGSPFFSAAQVSITGGSVNVSRATSVPSQSVSVGVAGQTLGGFDINVAAGESVTAGQLQFTATISRASGSSATVSDIRNARLVSSNGTTVSGSVDGVGSGTTGTITFTSLSFPSGTGTYRLQGTLGTSFREGDVITLSLTPSTDFTGIRGQSSGTSLTASPSSSISANPVNVRSATLTVSVSSSPSAQTVVAGAQNFVFAQFNLDVSASGEDIRLTSLPVRFTFSGSTQNLSNCQLVQGSTALTTGGNAVTPSSSQTSGTDITFTFDNALVITKGTVAALGLRCNVSTSAQAGATYNFGIMTAPTTVGVQSGQTITANVVGSIGPTMTIATSGTFTVTADFSSPAYTLAPAGSLQTAAVLSFRAGNEAVNIQQVALQLSPTTGSASSSPSDLTTVTLWDESGSQIGTAFFAGSNRTATVQLTGNFIVPQNGQRLMTIKAQLAAIGTGQPGTEGALVKIDYDGDAAASTRGIGQSSGTTLTSGTSVDTDTAGIRFFRTTPLINLSSLTSTTLTSGEGVLMRFNVNADANGSLGIHKISLGTSASSGVTLSDVTISAYTDSSFSSPASGNAQGRLDPTPQSVDGSGNVEIYAKNSSGTLTPFQVPAGTTRYFEVRGIATGGSTGSNLTVRLLGDSAYPSLSTLMGTAAEVDADANDNFIWSPNFNGQSATTDRDWTNSFGARNLPSAGLTQTLTR